MSDAIEAGEKELSARRIVIAVACLLGSTFVPYVQVTIGPLMMLPMIEEFGWTRTQFAFATTFLFVFGSLTALVFGRLADRFGSRAILLVGAVGGGATMLLVSQQDAQLWRLYLAYALLGTFGASGLGYTKIIGTLFTRHRGKALALFGAESTLALATLPLLTNALNQHLGWRGTYVVYGLIMFVMAAVIYLLIRGPGISTRAPAPSAAVAGAPPGSGATHPVPEGLTPPELRRDRKFWLIMASAVLALGLDAGLTAHIIAAITDKGFTQTQAASVLSAGTFVGLAGTLVAGLAMDYFRTARILSVFALVGAIGCGLLGVANAAFGGLALLITGLSLQRAGRAALVPATTYLLTRFAGMRSFGEAFAMQVLIQGLAMGVAPPLFGLLYQSGGSYAPMYGILIAAAVAAAVIYPLLGDYRYAAGAGPAAGAGRARGVRASAAA